jgi:minor extracellular serine protease Vpr
MMSKNKFTEKVFAAIILVISLSSCSWKNNPSLHSASNLNSDKVNGQDIVSTRPQELGTVLLLVQLKQPALLTRLKSVEGQIKPQVDLELKKLIEAEQIEVISKIKSISSEIKLVYRYQLVLNAITVAAPSQYVDAIRKISAVNLVEKSQTFARPQVAAKSVNGKFDLTQNNSVKFIGAPDLWSKGISGQGIKVGIIDTGIDYTHSMLGGTGVPADFKAINPSLPSAFFPNKKVVGGIDLVGTKFNAASDILSNRIPIIDENPIDEGGHGTHVAGTVAGIGDDEQTYSGVAPKADLYAIKVFGADGSTGDEVVIAALEYSANTLRDGTLGGQLDVVNLSLGSGYGNPRILYNQAIQNLSRAGTSVVISAGNSGDVDFIVGAPGTSDDAISVAASIDNGEHNWKFPAVKFVNSVGKEFVVEALEGSISKPISEAGNVSGDLVYVGLATEDLSSELAAQVKGKVAFIDRGKVAFAEKVRRAFAAGAIGVVIANNQPGEAFGMGGEGRYDIPAIMITLALGDQIKSDLKVGSVKIDFQTDVKIEKPERIDTITGFSSKGPRSFDGILKPEISAPGSDIISAEMGGGTKPVKMSGTSMAAPHMAGVMALLIQSHPDLSSSQLKSLAMGTAKTIYSKKDIRYPVSRMGAGRVQIAQADAGRLVSDPAAISLGLVNLESKKVMPAEIKLKNITDSKTKLQISLEEAAPGLSLKSIVSFNLEPKEEKLVKLRLVLDRSQLGAQFELDGFIVIKESDTVVLRVPVLAVVQQISKIQASELKVRSASESDSAGALAELNLINTSEVNGKVYLFNLLGRDGRKAAKNQFVSTECDLEAAGYRILGTGNEQKVQFVLKVYQPVTSWNLCEPSILIDSDGDGIADQELAGMTSTAIPGVVGPTQSGFASFLLDAKMARDIRRQFEVSNALGVPAKEDYSLALIDAAPMLAQERSTMVILEAPLKKLSSKVDGSLAVKILTSHYESAPEEVDNNLGGTLQPWMNISSREKDQAYYGMPDSLTIKGNETQTVDLTKGSGLEPLLVVSPDNSRSSSDFLRDQQSSVISPKFEP